jgi:hypothetical protein
MGLGCLLVTQNYIWSHGFWPESSLLVFFDLELAAYMPTPQFSSGQWQSQQARKLLTSFEKHQMNFVNDNSIKVPACA